MRRGMTAGAPWVFPLTPTPSPASESARWTVDPAARDRGAS